MQCRNAGVAGYTWVAVFHLWCGLSFRTTLLLANITSVAWLFIYNAVLPPPKLEAVSQLSTLSSRSNSMLQVPQQAVLHSSDAQAADAAVAAAQPESMMTVQPSNQSEVKVLRPACFVSSGAQRNLLRTGNVEKGCMLDN